MRFDRILTRLGEFGPYQKRVYFLLCLIAISGGIQVMSSVFILATPDHRCAVPGLLNDTYAIKNDQHRKQVTRLIHLDDFDDVNQCQVVIDNVTSLCNTWVYDKSVFQRTFTSQENWVCDQKMMKSHTQMLFMAGSGTGSLALGLVADLIGRKRALLLSLLLHFIASLSLAFSVNFPMFATITFILGMSVSGSFDNAFVLGMELVGSSKRIWAGMVIELFWSSGGMVLTLAAYFIRDWKILQIVMGAPTVLFLSYQMLIPESARWLITNGQYKEAETILKSVAKSNKRTWSNEYLTNVHEDEEEQSRGLCQVFNKPRLLLRTLIILFNWTVCSLGYYGLGLNVGNLGGNIFVNFLASASAETAGFLLALLLLDRIGRKPLYCGVMIIGGVTCISSLFPVLYAPNSLNWLTVTLAMSGRGFISCAFGTLWIFSSELFPTVLRTSGLGASSTAARVGGIIAPYIAGLANLLTGDISKAVPMIVFGLCMMVAGMMSLLLPETLNRDLPETLDDAETFDSSPRQFVPVGSDDVPLSLSSATI